MDRGRPPAGRMTPPVVIIAGSDPSGGAGVSRDVDTLARIGGEARAVITAVTVQTDRAVERIASLPPVLVTAQLNAALAGRIPGAIKIGMLGSAAIAAAVAKRLAAETAPIVLDPVLAASSGAVLTDRACRDAMIEMVFPQTHLLTPNLQEAAALTSLPHTEAAIPQQAEALLALGPRHVLIKGGHGGGDEAVDHLFSNSGQAVRFSAPRRHGSPRGTGCTMATAIAGFLAAGQDLQQACHGAKELVLKRFDADTPVQADLRVAKDVG